MATKLESLLSKIDPSRTYDEVSARVDRAFNSFSMPRGAIASYEEYENVMADFCYHIEKKVFKFDLDSPDFRKQYWTRAEKLIEKAYRPNGYHTVFTIVSTGKEGGLY